MNEEHKPIEQLQVADLRSHPIWQYVNTDAAGETNVQPVRRIPVESLTGKLVAVQVCLANGNLFWGLIGNLDPKHPQLSQHFLTLSVEYSGKWFALSRYHDPDYTTNGPSALTRFLGLDIDQVFPISYDVTRYVKGDPSALSGKIFKEPRERLTRAQIIAMAVP